MRTLVLLALFAGVAFAQEPSRPFPNHEQPPEGWHCRPASNAKEVQTDAHACDCRGMVLDDPEEHCRIDEEQEDGSMQRVPRGESTKCKSFCHKDHCTCSKRCADS